MYSEYSIVRESVLYVVSQVIFRDGIRKGCGGVVITTVTDRIIFVHCVAGI